MRDITRRGFLKLAGTSVIGITAGGIALRSNAQEQLSLDDPTAKALQYVHESKMDGKYCANCRHIQGDASAEWRPCALFPNKLVNAKGWCAGWTAMPS